VPLVFGLLMTTQSPRRASPWAATFFSRSFISSGVDSLSSWSSPVLPCSSELSQTPEDASADFVQKSSSTVSRARRPQLGGLGAGPAPRGPHGRRGSLRHLVEGNLSIVEASPPLRVPTGRRGVPALSGRGN
jgi:hypothetical protein